MLDHPRSAIAGLSFILKFGFDPIYSFGDIAIFIFCRFGWNLPIQAHFWEVLGAYFPQIWSAMVLTPKRTILARKHVVKIGPAVRPGRKIEKKGKDRTGQDSQKKS